MIRSIRARLQWWYGAVYALSIVVFGSLVYWRADRDVHERATLQAVSTAQYLDVSLRNVSPRVIKNLDADALAGQPGGHMESVLRPEFLFGSMPPEFQVRPPRDREFDRRPPQDRKSPDHQMRDQFPVGPPPPAIGDRHPPRRPFGPNDRGAPDGVRGNRPDGDENADGSPPDRPQPRMDAIEFAIWRPNSSLLTTSSEFPGYRISQMPALAERIATPRISMERRQVEVSKRGPHGTTILVLRSLENDMSGLHRFGFQIAAMAVATLAIGLLGGWWISGRMVEPIQMISHTASQISATSLNRRIETAHLDQELVQLGSVLNGTFARLEQAFGRLTQFTADASHELRTPLAVIQSQAELALSRPRSPEAYQETLEICLKSADRMRSLIDGLLLLARTDSERLELRPAPIDLRNIAEDAVAQLLEKAAAAKIELECVTSDTMVMVDADARFLTQVPVNLIDNAIQHSASDGKIIVRVRIDGVDAVLTVQDYGAGIAAQHLPQLFERFYRVDAGRSRKHGGSGLGLAICRSLVDAHQGTIHCESTPGEGTTFTVRLPLSKTSHSVNPEQNNV